MAPRGYTAKDHLGHDGLVGFQYFFTEKIALEGEILYRMLTIPEMTYTEHESSVWVRRGGVPS